MENIRQLNRFFGSTFVVAITIGLIGCGKKAEPKATSLDLNNSDSGTLQKIATTQGWKLEDVEARDRAFTSLEANQQPTDADWQQLVKAADIEKNGFDLSLGMEFSRHLTDKYRPTVLKWCERNMEQAVDKDAAILGYSCYVRSGGTEKDLWASRLKSRGQFYVDKIAEIDARTAKK